MGLLLLLKKKFKKASPDASPDTSGLKKDTSDMSSYISDISATLDEKGAALEAARQPKENPLMTISRQLAQLQYQVGEIKPAIDSGVQSLREDHYRIIEEQAKSAGEYKDYVSKLRDSLLGAKAQAEKELENLEIDSKILDSLSNSEKRAVEIAESLKASRQYVSDRLNHLLKLNQITARKHSRNVFYTKKAP